MRDLNYYLLADTIKPGAYLHVCSTTYSKFVKYSHLKRTQRLSLSSQMKLQLHG